MRPAPDNPSSACSAAAAIAALVFGLACSPGKRRQRPGWRAVRLPPLASHPTDRLATASSTAMTLGKSPFISAFLATAASLATSLHPALLCPSVTDQEVGDRIYGGVSDLFGPDEVPVHRTFGNDLRRRAPGERNSERCRTQILLEIASREPAGHTGACVVSGTLERKERKIRISRTPGRRGCPRPMAQAGTRKRLALKKRWRR